MVDEIRKMQYKNHSTQPQNAYRRISMSVKLAFSLGALAGILISSFLVSVSIWQPFSAEINTQLYWLTFKLCPLFILMYLHIVSSLTAVYVITIIGNGALYGLICAAVYASIKGIGRVARI